ncbi:MAG TPA: endonuclease III [Actinomycetota bacterium]|nr:endonuclease III [Actinomycetota bacterium]
MTAPDPEAIREIHRRLRAWLGPLRPPRRTDPLDELILTVLSQHTSDANSERAYAALRKRFPTWDAVVRARTRTVADTIRSGGLANTKAARIRAILREIHEREGSFDLSWMRTAPDEEVEEYLRSLLGVGPKTVAVVRAFALGRPTIPVDTHVHRVSRRLGLVPLKTSAEAAHRLLEEVVPARLKVGLHVGLITLGREICKAGSPRCEECPLAELCPTAPTILGRG